MYVAYIWAATQNTCTSSDQRVKTIFLFWIMWSPLTSECFPDSGNENSFCHLSKCLIQSPLRNMEFSVLTSLCFELQAVGELGSLPTDTSREKSLLHPEGKGVVQRGSLPKQNLLSNYFSIPSYHMTGNLYLRTFRAMHPLLSRDVREHAENYCRLNLI